MIDERLKEHLTTSPITFYYSEKRECYVAETYKGFVDHIESGNDALEVFDTLILKIIKEHNNET